MTKHDSWPLFRMVWEDAFTAKNIHSAWEPTGIHPFDLDMIIVRQKSLLVTSPNKEAVLSISSLSSTAWRSSLSSAPSNSAAF
jgi:hypothetical protein